MQRIREQQQPIAFESLGGEHRRGSATHRAPADDQRQGLQLLAHARDDGREAFLQSRHWIGAPGLLFLVKEVEADDAKSAFTEGVRGLKDSVIVHVPAGAVGADEDYAIPRAASRRLEDR